MINQGQCQHCAGLYEYEAGSKSEFCPHCGKETYCAALPDSEAVKAKSQSATKSRAGWWERWDAVLLDIGAMVFLIVGCFMLPTGLGVVVILLSLILSALVHIIRKGVGPKD